tara:strand:+ start:17096 stop:20380 length:3285 start_codon:yes stop_codon:yes gene_type:complete
MNPQHTSNFLPDLVSRLDAASQEKQSGLWDTTKAVAGGLGQGLTNVGRGAMGIAETAAGGIGTLGAGIAAGGEALTDAAGITDPSFNTSWQAAKNMGEFTAGGAKNVGSVFGLRGADALMGREANPVTQSHERMMDEGGMSDRAKAWTRGGLGVGRAAAQAVPFIAGGGAIAGGGGAIAGGLVPEVSKYTGNNPDAQLAAQRPGAQLDDWLPGNTMEFDESGQQVPPPAAPSPAAPLDDNYKGFEVDGWRPISGKDTFKMSADQNSSKLRELFIKALTRKDSSPGFLDKLVDRLRDVRDVGLVGAGGVSAGGSANFLRKQLKHVKNYNPTVVTPGAGLKKVLSLLREGDVVIQGDAPSSRVTGSLVRDMFGGGMGGFDEHAQILTKPVRDPKGRGTAPKLRAVYTGAVVGSPKARRSRLQAAGGLALKRLRKSFAPGKAFNLGKKYLNHYGDPEFGSISPERLDKALRSPKETFKAWEHLDDMARVAADPSDGPLPFSILRAKDTPSQAKVHKGLQQLGNTTFSGLDTAQSAVQRRLLPNWVSALHEKLTGKPRGASSFQGTNCAGGVCKVLTGKGGYRLPSDLRHMKEFKTVGDYIPETVLKRYGATAKNLEPLKRVMRRGSFKAAIPGLLLGSALATVGAGGGFYRHQQKSASAAQGIRRLGKKLLEKFPGLLGKNVKPLFGKDIAERARKHGLSILAGHEDDFNRPIIEGLNRANREAGRKVYYGNQVTMPKEMTKGPSEGVLVNFAGLGADEAKQLASTGSKAYGLPTRHLTALDDKLEEANILKKVIAKTVGVGDIMKKYNITTKTPDAGKRLQDAFRKELGDKFILKPRDGYATPGGSLPTHKTEPNLLMKMLQGKAGDKNVANYEKTWNKPDQFVAQVRHDLAKNSPIERFVDNFMNQYEGAERPLGRSLYNAVTGKSPVHHFSVGSGGHKREWRVHTTGGKVVPYATSGRGSMLGMLPWWTKNKSLAEQAAQKMLDKFPANIRKSSFGLDVAKTKDGRFVLIESNPSNFEGASGLMSPGPASITSRGDAIESAVMGRLPAHIKAQRQLKATGAAGGAAGAGMVGMGMLTPEQQPNPLQSFLDRRIA